MRLTSATPPWAIPSRVPCRQPLLEESLQQYFGDDTTPAHLKLADVPGDDTTRLIACAADAGTVGPFPLVAVRNVFVLPGVHLWTGCEDFRRGTLRLLYG